MNRAEKNSIEQDSSGNLMKVHCYNCTQKLDVSSLTPFSRIHCPKCDTEIIVPMWFDHYLFEEQVGEGKFAKVYRALDLTLDREAAVKVLKPEHEAKYGELFLKAARKAAQLNHFSITPIYSCGEFENQSYFVSQYINDGTLADLLQEEGPQPIEKAIPWMIEITEGLYYASKQGMVHHAVSLEHMPLVEGRAKISDFTSSFFEGESPEVSRNVHNEDNLDIFNLGVAFYQLLTGSSPTEGDAGKYNIPDNIQKLILKMLTEGAVNRISYSEIIRVLKGGEINVEIAVPPSEVEIEKTSILKQWRGRIIAITALILVIIVAIIFNNLNTKKLKADYLRSNHLPKVTQAMNNNSLVAANKLAAAVLKDVNASLVAKQEAALLFVLTSGLNNDRKLSEKCAYATKMLEAAKVSKGKAIYALLAYPANIKMQPKQLLKLMNRSLSSKALANFMIVLRYLYYGCPQDKFILALDKLDQAMSRCSRNSWVYQTLNSRSTLYRALITKDEIIPNAKPEPVLQAFIAKLENPVKTIEDKP
jgi:serine/threonine protein kinase